MCDPLAGVAVDGGLLQSLFQERSALWAASSSVAIGESTAGYKCQIYGKENVAFNGLTFRKTMLS